MSYKRSMISSRSDERLKYSTPKHRKNESLSEPKSDKFTYNNKELTSKARWEKFRVEFKSIEEELSKKYKNYEVNFEEHPSYQNKWKTFWKKRYSELISNQQDPKTHDFKSEWIPYWKEQLLEYKMTALQKAKVNLLKKLNLINNAKNSKTNVRDHSPSLPSSSKSSSLTHTNPLKEENILKRSSDSKGPPQKRIALGTPDPRSKPLQKRSNIMKPFQKNKLNNLNIIDVLRLLTAIEDQLGSVGPKINDLLSEALSLEKIKTHLSNGLLKCLNNRVLLETIKEKLFGQLISGIIEKHHLPVTRKCIDSIEYILKNYEKLIPKEENEIQQQQQQQQSIKMEKESSPDEFPVDRIDFSISFLDDLIENPVQVKGIGTFEKEFLAQQLASCLITLKLENITQNQLEIIINEIIENKSEPTENKINALEMNDEQKEIEKSKIYDILKNLPNREFAPLLTNLTKKNENDNFVRNMSDSLSSFPMQMGPKPSTSTFIQKSSIFTDSDDSIEESPRSNTKVLDNRSIESKYIDSAKVINETTEIIANIMEQLPKRNIQKRFL